MLAQQLGFAATWSRPACSSCSHILTRTSLTRSLGLSKCTAGHTVRRIPVVTATPENFAPFGTLLGDTSTSSTSTHYQAVRVVNPSTNFASDEDT